MDALINKVTTGKLVLIALIGTLFVSFPNIVHLSWELSFLPESSYFAFFGYAVSRFTCFFVLTLFLLWYNLSKLDSFHFLNRFLHNLTVTAVVFLAFFTVSYLLHLKFGHFSTLFSQFCVICIGCTFAGHLFYLYYEQQLKKLEIERLKTENLQSRCNALANQINPHFFFNSLNGLSALIRKKEDDKTLAYVDKLSDVFRYILQSDKKGLVTLREELTFVESFRYMMEVRFANKLVFDINVDEADMELKIPVLSILPLIENVVVHNTIDSDHLMEVSIRLNERKEIVVSNPVFLKREPADTNGIGIQNLEKRFMLLMDKQVRIMCDGKVFRVYLPLK